MAHGSAASRQDVSQRPDIRPEWQPRADSPADGSLHTSLTKARSTTTAAKAFQLTRFACVEGGGGVTPKCPRTRRRARASKAAPGTIALRLPLTIASCGCGCGYGGGGHGHEGLERGWQVASKQPDPRWVRLSHDAINDVLPVPCDITPLTHGD